MDGSDIGQRPPAEDLAEQVADLIEGIDEHLANKVEARSEEGE